MRVTFLTRGGLIVGRGRMVQTRTGPERTFRGQWFHLFRTGMSPNLALIEGQLYPVYGEYAPDSLQREGPGVRVLSWEEGRMRLEFLEDVDWFGGTQFGG